MFLKVQRLLAEYVLFVKDTFLDAYYYYIFSTLRVRKKNKENYSALILAHVHSIERAFSLKNTRAVFGIELVSNLKSMLDQIDDTSKYRYEIEIANRALAEYSIYHGIKVDKISTFKPYKLYAHVEANSMSRYRDIVYSRSSVRNFSDTKINNLDVLKAIAMAKNKTPSVCNRQGWEVVLVRNLVCVNQVLALQNGNSGIENVQNVLVVCSTLTSFFGSNERNQPYVDGGLFLMSLLNSLHYRNIAGCSLNWSVDRNKDQNLKDLLGIDNSKVIISLIGIGSYSRNKIEIASSYKKPLTKMLKIIE